MRNQILFPSMLGVLALVLFLSACPVEAEDSQHWDPGLEVYSPGELNRILDFLRERSPTMRSSLLRLREVEQNIRIARAQRLPNVSADIQFNVTAEDREDFEDIFWRQRPFNRISASQPLFRWFALKRAQENAHLQVEYMELSHSLTLRNLVRETRERYFQVLELQLVRDLAEARMEAERRNVEREELNLELGRASSDEYLQAVTRFQEDQTRLYDAQRRLQSTLTTFKARTGYREPILQDYREVAQALLAVEVEPIIPDSIPREDLETEETLRLANLAEQAEKDQVIQRARTRPNLSLLVQVFQDEISQRGLEDSITRNNLFLGIRVVWNIFDGWEGDARVRQAELRQRRYELELDQARIDLLDQVEQTLSEIRLAEDAIAARRQQLDYLDERVEKARIELDQGRITEDDLFNIRVSRDQAHYNLVRAYVDYVLLRAGLNDILEGSIELASAFPQG